MAANLADFPCITGQEFANFLLTELPVYSETILRDVRPTDMLAAHISSGSWDPFSGVQQYQDRFNNVQPDTTAKWHDVSETACEGAPCDPPMNEICWGYERVQYGQKTQSWKSQLLCFDQLISATKAAEHMAQIVSDILRPATARITSEFVRRENLNAANSGNAGIGSGTRNTLLADATMSTFTHTWETDGDQEIFMTPSAFPTSKLTPQMLMRLVQPLRNIGYFGKWTNDPFWGGYDQFAELITDDDTAWELSKIASDTRISDAWRFTQWDSAHDYFKYGMAGTIGNFMLHVDPFPMRFNKKGAKLQRVLPYKNTASTAGLKSINNPDYFLAPYQISTIHHRFSWQLLTQKLQAVNALMPFLVRDLGGQWQFAINDLGQDCNGNTIANFRQNKGFFFADWRLAAKPQHTEWEVAILHLREPQVVYTVGLCGSDPGYPTQVYNSACDACDTTYEFTPEEDESGNYVLDASTVTCGSELVENEAISAATVALLATAMNASGHLGALGTWSADGTKLVLTGATCAPVLPWVA
jgi:hypothetical protein